MHDYIKPLILTFIKLDMFPALAGFGMPFYNHKAVTADLFGDVLAMEAYHAVKPTT